MFVPLRVEGYCVYFILMAFERPEKLGVLLLFDHLINLNNQSNKLRRNLKKIIMISFKKRCINYDLPHLLQVQ
jgi:hypothetical protein